MLDDAARLWFKSEVDEVAEAMLPSEQLSLFQTFSHHFIHIHLSESLLAWRPADMFGALHGLYDFFQQRTTDTTAHVKVFNPDMEQDGWESLHTVIVINQRDMPFLVDSLRMALNRLGLNIYLFESLTAWVQRDEEGSVLAISDTAPDTDLANYEREHIALVQVDLQGEGWERESIKQDLLGVLAQVDGCVSDYQPMLQRLKALIRELEAEPEVDTEDLAFLRWLHDGNFTLLGLCEFQIARSDTGEVMHELSEQRLGLMRQREPLQPARLDALSPGFGLFYNSSASLGFTKSSRRSTVHRAVYSDYVLIKRRDANGKPIGEVRLLGLYTSKLYHSSVKDIPLIRKKAASLEELSRFEPASHDGKAFAAVLEGHPRDELIQTDIGQMLDISLGIWRIIDRRAVRLFMRNDPFEKFVSCIVYLPKESFSTTNRQGIERKLREELDAEEGEFNIQFLSESVLVRIHFFFRICNRKYKAIDHAMLEQEIVELVRDWTSELKEAIQTQWGSTLSPALIKIWASAFEPAYQHEYSAEECTNDIGCVTALTEDEELGLRFFNHPGSADDIMRLKLFRLNQGIELSDIIPMLENLGFRVLGEQPHQITLHDGSKIWMLDFTLRFTMNIKGALDVDAVREQFKQAFLAVWRRHSEDDEFNRLVLGARLDWHAAALLRAYANYLKQLGSPFGLVFIADVLSRQLEITRNLMALFRRKFDPRLYANSTHGEEHDLEHRADRVERLASKIIADLEHVANRNEDELIRQYLQLLLATSRTNYFQPVKSGESGEYLALKIETEKLDFAPKPRPMFEIYVHSTRFEGVHLRGGKIARGGIRWSDRFEDYRTEVLGLVKAQHVKNAVIVPTGAKGGFIARQADPTAGRDAWLEEGISCYRLFINALLDITDNRVDGAIVKPENVVCADGEDPYLVVAADKGTATFSDTANEISEKHGHWLGDAFASGGSNGYDHKAMGITARGAWVAVQRHFRELGTNVQSDSIDVIGIGDMSGDVFGNGMLLSEEIRVVAAFNHLHIFIDPNPDPAASFAERQRLFALPRSGWADYNTELMSNGGGVFERSAKTIPVSAQMQQLLDCTDTSLEPDLMINRLLKAKVDLIWNGGVGTYVKGSNESDALVGDRANDSLRVTGEELRCKVIGEGGNLGFTQEGRIEFCQNGGICNTDFIDNAAGVDCSDNEVNIKILLDTLAAVGKLSVEQRNETLRDMTNDVADLVLHSNYRQTLAISLAGHNRDQQQHDYVRFMQFLEEMGALDRQLEYLPDDEQLRELTAKGIAWSRPELSVLISYAKVWLKDELNPPEPHSDEYLLRYLFRAFPQQLNELAPQDIRDHQLANEIIATRIANDMVNRMGFTYCFRLVDSLGVSPMQVANTFVVVMHLFDLDALWVDIEEMDYSLAAQEQYELLSQVMELARRASRWYLRNRRSFSPAEEIAGAQASFETLLADPLSLHQPDWRLLSEQSAAALEKKGVPQSVATRSAVLNSFFFFPGATDVALETGTDVRKVARLCFSLTSTLQIDWLLKTLLDWHSEDRWQDLARESHIDELELVLRQLTLNLLQRNEGKAVDVAALEDDWRSCHGTALTRFTDLMSSLRGTEFTGLAVVTVVLDELKNLIEAH
ncbi:MAG: glutamate dehydrogenase [Halioglobus sp.]|jgi:glutamate dehydrogenase